MKKRKIIILIVLSILIIFAFLSSRIIKTKIDYQSALSRKKIEIEKMSEGIKIKGDYELALKEAKKLNILYAAKTLQGFINKYPHSSFTDDVWFELAKLPINEYRQQGEYWEAAACEHLKLLIAQYPNSEYIELAEFLIPWCYFRMGQSNYTEKEEESISYDDDALKKKKRKQ